MGRTADIYRSITLEHDVIVSYSGRCDIQFEDQNNVAAHFHAAQRTDGRLLLLLVSPQPFPQLDCQSEIVSIAGSTIDAQEMNAYGNLAIVESSHDSEHGTEALVNPNTIDIGFTSQPVITQAEYVLTNLQLRPFNLRLDEPTAHATLSFTTMAEYNRFIGEMKFLSLSRPTTLATLMAEHEDSSPVSPDDLDTIMDMICDATSFLRGTKVQWIRVSYFGSDGRILRTRHEARITKLFGGLYLIAEEALGSTLAKIVPNYAALRDTFQIGIVVDSLIDAKSPHDYLESRAVKLCVTLEMLLSVFAATPASKREKHSLGSSANKRLVRALRQTIDEVVQREGGSAEIANKLKYKMGVLNHTSFTDRLTHLCGYVDMHTSRHEIGQIKQMRNSLVHTGNFLDLPEQSEAVSIPDSKIEQFLLLSDFVDRLILKLLGYTGSYLARRSPNGSDWSTVEI